MQDHSAREMTHQDRVRIRERGPWLSYGLPALLVFAFLALLIALRNSAETAAADLVTFLPVGYAFGAGVVSSVNPCGFMLLPSYISYQLGSEEEGFYDSVPLRRAGRALVIGGVATAGFIVIFAAVGAVLTLGGQWVVSVFPYAGLAVGLVMAALGLWLLATHRTLGIMAASRVGVAPGRNLRNVFLFGTAYSIGSLSCTLPVFLVVVGGALGSLSPVQAFGQFVSYALGMGTILVAVTLGAALFRGAVARFLRSAVPYVHRVSALFLVSSGAYLVYYWLFFARLF